MKKIVKYGILILLFGLCLFSLIYIDSISDAGVFKAVKSVEHSVSEYDSSSNQPDINTPAEFIENIDKEYKDTHISFDMEIYTIDNYNNIFQTAPANSGLRMELSQPSKLAFLAAVKSEDNTAFTGGWVGSSYQFNKWYKVDIAFNKNNRLIIKVDNAVVIDQYWNNMSYKISDIAVGTGYSKTRPFKGAIKNFIIIYTLFESDNTLFLYSKILKVILFLGCLVLIYFILFPEELKAKPK
jgi:hypothetical protein